MGWLTMPFASMGGHLTAKAYLDAQFTYTREADGISKGLRVLASSCPQNRTYYAATQVMTNGVGGDIFAIVCKVLWCPGSKTGELRAFELDAVGLRLPHHAAHLDGAAPLTRGDQYGRGSDL